MKALLSLALLLLRIPGGNTAPKTEWLVLFAPMVDKDELKIERALIRRRIGWSWYDSTDNPGPRPPAPYEVLVVSSNDVLRGIATLRKLHVSKTTFIRKHVADKMRDPWAGKKIWPIADPADIPPSKK